MQIVSTAFNDNEMIPDEYTAAGPNINPPLQFTDVPASAQSLVLLVQDRDATPIPWKHWLVFNIPVTTTTVEAGMIPAGGTEGHANGGTPGYEGPNQIYFSGTHHYEFILFALDNVLELPETADWQQVEPLLTGHTLAEATLVGLATGTMQST